VKASSEFLGLRHAAVTVKNLAQSLRFYTEVLGFSRFLDQDSDWAMVSFAGTTLSLVSRTYSGPLPSEASSGGSDALPPRGIHHLGLVVSSIQAVDQMYQHLTLPATLASYPSARAFPPKLHRDRSYGFYLQDPDGNLLEWIYVPSVPYLTKASVTPVSDPFELEYQKTAIILLAHGSSDAQWTRPILALRDRLRSELPAVFIAEAYMEFARPTLEDTLQDLLRSEAHSSGVKRVLIFPQFISSGGHVMKDLPSIIASASRILPPDWKVELAETLGEPDWVREAMVSWISGRLRRESLPNP